MHLDGSPVANSTPNPAEKPVLPIPAASDSRVPRGDRERGAAQPRQARHDAPAVGASLADFRALSGADRKRRRQSFGERAARHRAGARPALLGVAAGDERAHRGARRHPRSVGAGAGGRIAGACQRHRDARGTARQRRSRAAHRAGRLARRRQVDARPHAGAASGLAVHRARSAGRGGLRRQHSRSHRDGRHGDVPPP